MSMENSLFWILICLQNVNYFAWFIGNSKDRWTSSSSHYGTPDGDIIIVKTKNYMVHVGIAFPGLA